MRRLALLVALLIVATAEGVRAQQLRGAVRDTASSAPIPGAVVTISDAAGGATARAITDAAGRYVVALSPSAARVRFIRIGFRPRDLLLPPVERRGAFDVAMDRIPPMLEAVRVSGKEICPGSNDRGAALDAWDQARAGLLATVVAREAKPAKVTTLVYVSGMSPDDDRIRRQTKYRTSGTTTRPFVAGAAPSFFAKYGYMSEDSASNRIFNAPDADVLLDGSFAATHCFHIRAADAGHPGQVGLAFTPAPGRDTLVDVDGVVWLDARTPQLRALDFLYTSLEPAAMEIHAGGHIEFRMVDNGVSFIERWHLRLPVLEARVVARRPFNSGPQRRTRRDDVDVAEVNETGGIVLQAVWSDGTRWKEAPTLITGVVTQRGTKAPLAGGIVTLAGTGDTVSTSATGAFEINAIPGKYTVVAADTALQNFVEVRRQSASVEVTRGTVASMKLEVAPTSSRTDEVCHGEALPPETSIIVGSVALRDRALPKGAVVRASWIRDVRMIGAGVDATHSTREITVDGDGQFVVCGVPRGHGMNLSLSSRQLGQIADTTVTPSVDALTVPVRWLIDPKR